MTDVADWKVRLPSWRDVSARRSVIAFLQEITQGPDALPLADRVAAFDNDGTLACEKPRTALAGFLLDRTAAAGTPAPNVTSGHDVLRELGSCSPARQQRSTRNRRAGSSAKHCIRASTAPIRC